MSIAVNANQPTSPFGGADVRLSQPPKTPARPNGEVLLAVTIYKHLAPDGTKTACLVNPL